MRRRQRRERHRGAAPDPGGGNNSPRPPCFALRRCRAAGFGGRPCAWFQKRRGKGGVFSRPEVAADAFRAAHPPAAADRRFRCAETSVLSEEISRLSRESVADVFQGKSVLLFQAFFPGTRRFFSLFRCWEFLFAAEWRLSTLEKCGRPSGGPADKSGQANLLPASSAANVVQAMPAVRRVWSRRTSEIN